MKVLWKYIKDTNQTRNWLIVAGLQRPPKQVDVAELQRFPPVKRRPMCSCVASQSQQIITAWDVIGHRTFRTVYRPCNVQKVLTSMFFGYFRPWRMVHLYSRPAVPRAKRSSDLAIAPLWLQNDGSCGIERTARACRLHLLTKSVD